MIEVAAYVSERFAADWTLYRITDASSTPLENALFRTEQEARDAWHAFNERKTDD